MSTPTPLDIKVTLGNHPITGELTYKIDEESANPPLSIYRGFLYRITVQTNSTHPFVIKHSSGDLNFGQYNTGISGNGSFNSIIEWQVLESTPNFLIYQSPNDKKMMGLIKVKSPDSYLPNSMKIIDESKLSDTTLSELVNVFNHNCSIALTTNDSLAGRGLKFNNRKLELDTYGDARFFLDDNNRLIFADTKITLDDKRFNIASYSNPNTLLSALSALATSIRQLKNPNEPFYNAPIYTLKDISDIAKGVEEYAINVESTLVDLQRKYEELLIEYEELLEYFTNHTHDASDIKTGILNPALLGRGIPNSSTYLRGDGNWTNVSDL